MAAVSASSQEQLLVLSRGYSCGCDEDERAVDSHIDFGGQPAVDTFGQLLISQRLAGPSEDLGNCWARLRPQVGWS